MKRLTRDQKCWAVAIKLFHSTYPKSAYALGQEIGFADGQPIRDTLRHLLADGHVEVFEGHNNLGTKVLYYELTDKSRQKLRDRGWDMPTN